MSLPLYRRWLTICLPIKVPDRVNRYSDSWNHVGRPLRFWGSSSVRSEPGVSLPFDTPTLLHSTLTVPSGLDPKVLTSVPYRRKAS